MIPVKDSLTNVDSLPGEEIKFAIGDPRFVMRANAKLYSDITTAIIREYSTNAHDAHVMAGNPDPIQVTLPSIMNPYFIVEDKGVGMDIDDFRQIYTQFGTSNKRESNDTNGTLGFGSKSGVAYTTQFTVTSVKDGVKIHGVIMRKPDWEIVLKVVSTSRADEPNGTKIQIPVHNVDEFVHKAEEFYKFWLPGRVEVNGRPPKHFVGEKIVDGLYFSEEWNTSRVVMGNVAYRINNPAALFQNTQMSRINFVAYVENGDVEFTPSREDLEYTDHTKNTLQRIVNDFETKIVEVAKSEIAAAETHSEAFLAWSKWTDRIGGNLFSDLEFKGDKFQQAFGLEGYRYLPNTYRGNTMAKIKQWSVKSDARTIYVTEFNVQVASRHKSMIKEYAKQQGWDYAYVVFTEATLDEIDSPWIAKEKNISLAELKKAVPPARKPRAAVQIGTPRVKGSWDYHTKTGIVCEKEIPELEDGNTLFHISVKEDKSHHARQILEVLGENDSIVVVVPANRKNKYLRENPESIDLIEHARSKVVINLESLLCDDAKRVLTVTVRDQQWFDALDMSRIDDEDIKALVNLIGRRDELLAAYNKNARLAQLCHMWYDCEGYRVSGEFLMSSRYPLLGSAPSYSGVHGDVYTYMNAKYSTLKDDKNE